MGELVNDSLALNSTNSIWVTKPLLLKIRFPCGYIVASLAAILAGGEWGAGVKSRGHDVVVNLMKFLDE